MNKLYIAIVIILLTSFSAVAADSGGITGFAQDVINYFSDFWKAITDGIPSLFQRMAAWAIEAALLIQFYLYFEGMKFAWGVAKIILDDLSISSTLASFFGVLPSTTRAILIDIRIPDAINVILNAFVTRAVMRMF